MQTPELAAKWDVEPSELQAAFDFIEAHHLRFVVVIAKAAMAAANPADTKIVVGELETAAAPTVGVSASTIALILQIIQAVYPIIAQILSIFLGSLTPPPQPKPPKAGRRGAVATAALLLTLLVASPALAGCSTTKDKKPADHREPPPAARAALAMHLTLASYTAPVGKEVTHTCVCTFRGTACTCPNCDCNCPDAESYAAGLVQSAARNTPIVVWVKTAIDRSVYPEAVHIRDDSFAGAKPGVVVDFWRDGSLGRVEVPQGDGRVTRERVYSALGYAAIPKAPTCEGGACKH